MTESSKSDDGKIREKNDEETAKASLEAYGYCTNVLRAWFGAYSIGVPALILTHGKATADDIGVRME